MTLIQLIVTNYLKDRLKGSQEAMLRVTAFSPGREIIILKCSGNLIAEL